MNSKNSKTSDPHRMLLNFSDELDKYRLDKYFSLSILAQKNIKMSYKNNKLKTSEPAQNEKLELPDGLYSVSDITQSAITCSKLTIETLRQVVKYVQSQQ